MRPHLPDDRLRAADVPPPDAPWDAITEFGHRFHAYKVAGSLARVSQLTVETHDRWQRTGTLPDDRIRLRVALFHTVRAVGLDGTPDPDTERWARALVRHILTLTDHEAAQ